MHGLESFTTFAGGLLYYHYILLWYPTCFGHFCAITREKTDIEEMDKAVVYIVIRLCSSCIYKTW